MKRFAAQIITGVLALCIMAYTAVQISLTVGDIIEVENAIYADTSKSISASAFVFRQETPLVSGVAGTPCYFFEDGEKVYKGAEVLRIYELDTDAAIQEQINELEKKVTILEKSSVSRSYSTTDLETLDSSISSRIDGIISAVGEGNLDAAALNEDELLVLMNRRYSIISAVSGYDYVIDSYKRRISALEAQLSGSSVVIGTSESGYYYSESDGYESVFTLSLLDDLTIEEYATLHDKTPDASLLASSAGKIVTSPKWYITVSLDRRTLAKLTAGKPSAYEYEISFPYSDNTTVRMRLDKTVSQTNHDTVIAVFVSDKHPENFNYTRSQPVELLYETFRGLKIPTSAIRVIDGKTSVYYLDGTVVRTKAATVLYDEGNGYCVCALPDEKDINRIDKTRLSLHDPVITAGKNLYDGKIINS